MCELISLLQTYVPTEHIPTISPNDRWTIRYELGWYAPIQYTILRWPHKFSLVCHGHVVTANCNYVHVCVRACMHGPVHRKCIGIPISESTAWMRSNCDCGVIWIRIKSLVHFWVSSAINIVLFSGYQMGHSRL